MTEDQARDLLDALESAIDNLQQASDYVEEFTGIDDTCCDTYAALFDILTNLQQRHEELDAEIAEIDEGEEG